MQQPPHLPPSAGAFPPVGLPPHLGPPKGLPGLPVALGGTAAVTRPNGLPHHHPLMLPTPPPLVSVPHTGVPPLGALPPSPAGPHPPLIVPPHHRLPPSPLTSSLSRAPSAGSITSVTSNHHHSVPASLDTSTHSTPSTAVPASSVDTSDRSGHVRPRSADRQRESPPSAKRARSRSPLQVTSDSESESDAARSPEPEASVLNKECHRTANAM